MVLALTPHQTGLVVVILNYMKSMISVQQMWFLSRFRLFFQIKVRTNLNVNRAVFTLTKKSINIKDGAFTIVSLGVASIFLLQELIVASKMLSS